MGAEIVLDSNLFHSSVHRERDLIGFEVINYRKSNPSLEPNESRATNGDLEDRGVTCELERNEGAGRTLASINLHSE